jgi:hypothetical protein
LRKSLSKGNSLCKAGKLRLQNLLSAFDLKMNFSSFQNMKAVFMTEKLKKKKSKQNPPHQNLSWEICLFLSL